MSEFSPKKEAAQKNSESADENIVPNQNASSMLLVYNQQNAYKDSELNKLRVNNKELEYRLKKTFDEHSVDLDRLQSQIHLLKEEIERLKLNQSRTEMNTNSSENLEYIKNVVYNYMTTKDQQVRINMIGAIMQILKFSRSEKQKIQSLIGAAKYSMV